MPSSKFYPSVIFQDVLLFATFDSLLAFSLVSRGCRSMTEYEYSNRRARYEANRTRQRWNDILRAHSVNGKMRCLVMHLCSHIADNVPSECIGVRGRSVQLPGMPDHDPVAAVEVEWGNTFPSAPNETDVVAVEWVGREEYPLDACGDLCGKMMLSVGRAASSGDRVGHVVSFGIVASNQGSACSSVVVSCLFVGDSEPSLRDVYWHYSVGGDTVIVLRRVNTSIKASSYFTQVGDEALISSHPVLFGQWFTDARKPEDLVSERDLSAVVELTSVQPFSLHCAKAHHSPSGGSLACLLDLLDSERNDASFISHVQREYYDRITDIVAAHSGNVFTVEEEVKTMVTPKGLWSYSTGYATRQEVHAVDAWDKRRSRLVAELKRCVQKKLRRPQEVGWFPFGIVSLLLTS